MIPHVKKALFIAMIAGVLACDQSSTGPGQPGLYPRTQASTQGSILAEIRGATAQFHELDSATAAGYVRAGSCTNAEGIRYRKPALFDAVIDLSLPEILLYEPKPDGDLQLVAVQYLVSSALWDATHSSPPSVGDQPFIDRRSAPFGAPFPNYSLVVWVWEHNPSGMYALQNPNVTC